ncbi:unnamed protein product [Effrenium voratum]|nr:unnamed protein product [Effrenium voratum]
MQPDKDGNTPSVMARCGGFAELSRWLRDVECDAGSEAAQAPQVPNTAHYHCDPVAVATGCLQGQVPR